MIVSKGNRRSTAHIELPLAGTIQRDFLPGMISVEKSVSRLNWQKSQSDVDSAD
jgi:hypothetical protein